MSEGLRTVLVAFGALAVGFTWQSIRTTAVPASAPDRLIAELRLAQFAALILTLSAGAYIGFAVVHENQPGVGLDRAEFATIPSLMDAAEYDAWEAARQVMLPHLSSASSPTSRAFRRPIWRTSKRPKRRMILLSS